MNVEMFFVKADYREDLMACIADRLRGFADPPNSQPDWGLERSYDVLLANEAKRKVAVSLPQDGWVAAIESKEVLDFALLQMISERLGTEVIACQLADVTGSCGYARCRSGQLVESRSCETDDDPLATLRAHLRERSVPHDLLTFREAVQRRSAGWEILQRC
jgi:hypothetical protein